MHHPRPTRLLLALIGAALLLAGASAAQDKLSQFRNAFREQLEKGDAVAMAKLVRVNEPEAVLQSAYLCVQIPKGLNDDQKRELDALNTAWKTAWKNDFVEKFQGVFSKMDEKTAASWRSARQSYDDINRTFTQNISDRNAKVFDDVGAKSEELAKQFEETGDRFHAGHSWAMAAISFDETYRSNKLTVERAADDYAKAVECYREMDFVYDPSYASVKVRLVALRPKAAGEDKPAPAPAPAPAQGGDDKPAAPAAAQAPPAAGELSAKLTFQALQTVDAFERPHFHADEIYVLWRPLVFAAVGTETKMDTVDKSPKFKRTGSAQLAIDSDLDGTFEKPITLTGNKQVVEFPIGLGDDKRSYALIMTPALEKDYYQGMQINMAPSDKVLNVYSLPAASMVGKLGETAIRVMDDDMNGVFGNLPQTWGHVGLTDKVFQPEMDSIVIGDGKRARPWSEYVPIGAQWYKLETAKFGTEIKAIPEKVETGTLKLDFKGPLQPTWLVLRGTGKFENTFLDLAADGKKGVAVPAGDWALFYGEMRKGAKQQTMKCLILPGEGMKPWSVDAGKETVVKLGEPFGFDFKFELAGEAIKVIGASVAVVGSAGERYERTWNCVPHPEAAWRKAGTKKASKSEKFPQVLDTQGLEKYGYPAVWKPLDLELPMKDKVDKVEVQVTEKKNKLFGQVESAWKG